MFDIINGIESERSIRVSVKRKWPQHRYAIDLQTLGILSCTSQFVQEFIVRVCDLQYLVAHRQKMNQMGGVHDDAGQFSWRRAILPNLINNTILASSLASAPVTRPTV